MKLIQILCFILIGSFVCAQNKPENKPPVKKIKHLHSDVLKSTPGKFDGNPFAYGNVIFEHEGTKLYSDTAVFYPDLNFFRAWSRVRIINDTVSMVSDSLEYDGNLKIAKGFKNVHLKDKKSELFADYVEYNRMTDVAKASGNVILMDPNQRVETEEMVYNRATGVAETHTGAVIRGKDGSVTRTQSLVYNTKTKVTKFDSNVNIETADYRIISDNMVMNSATDVTEFLGRSRVSSRKDPTQYIEMPEGGGVFNKKSGEAFLNKRSSVHRQGKVLYGDKMYFNDKTGFGWAKGDVLIDDPEEKRFLRGEYGEAHRDLDSAFVTNRAYAVKAFSKDSLYFHADTIMAVRQKDSTRLIRGYHNSRFFKSNVQGKADSIVFNETKGVLKFFRDPIMWADQQQITGDTIYAYNNMEKELMDSVRVWNNAFAISKVDSLTIKDFNQVKGKFMVAYYLNNKIDWIEVHENAQSITFVDDENKETQQKERIGINLSDCGIIQADINENEVEVLACKIQANSKLYPESKLPEKSRYLKDFKWRGEERMKRWQDIFDDPPVEIQIDETLEVQPENNETQTSSTEENQEPIQQNQE